MERTYLYDADAAAKFVVAQRSTERASKLHEAAEAKRAEARELCK